MIVIDASVVVKMLTEENGSERAVDRLQNEIERLAPDWLHAEVASALAKKVRFAGLPMEQAQQSLAALPMIMPDLAPTTPLLNRAMEISIELSHALYDCIYLALALESGCKMLTADKRFVLVAENSAYHGRVELLA